MFTGMDMDMRSRTTGRKGVVDGGGLGRRKEGGGIGGGLETNFFSC